VGYFRGVPIFVIFMVKLQVTKLSTHKFYKTVTHCTNAKTNSHLCIPFHYLHPVDSSLNPHGPLAQGVTHVMINEVNRELKKTDASGKAKPFFDNHHRQ